MRFRAGFTLIELIIFTAIFAVGMGAFLAVFTNVSGVAVRQGSTAEVQSQSQFLLQTVQHYVERSSMVSTTVNATTTTLMLRMSSTTEDPVIINMNGTAVQLKIGSGAAQNITSNKVEVSDLSFTRRSNPGGKNSVAVSFTVSYATGNTTQRYTQSLRTAVARVSAVTFDSDLMPGTAATYALGTSPEQWRSINNTIFFGASNNVGISDLPFTPSARLHVQGGVRVGNGNLYVDSSSYGAVLKSPSSTCWRLTVDKSGVIGATEITCP